MADDFVEVGTIEDAKSDSPHVIRIEGRSIGLFYHDEAFHATDLHCPHMGFPLTDGTVEDGILTCPWHHARFELDCGDTLDPFADDVQTYPVEIRNGAVYVSPTPTREMSPGEHWTSRLEHGLQEDISLIIAKAVLGLADAGIDYQKPVEQGVAFGIAYRDAGWGRGLTTLGVMANLLDTLDPEDRHRALYVGLSEVADESAGEPPRFAQEPLSNEAVPPDRLKRWFTESIEVRDADGSERVLRAAIRSGMGQDALAGMLVTAATDHLYLDTGHRLDFINKAFDTLDHIGWQHVDTVLPSLVPGLAMADRTEESASWRQPVDIAALCFEAAAELPDHVAAGEEATWEEPPGFADTILGDDPAAIIKTITDAIAAGATATELAEILAYCGAVRIAQFGTSNEFRDWNTVHHTYTYLNAVYGLASRTSAIEAYRGLFDGAMNVYLDRFLNTPPANLPSPRGDEDIDTALNELLDTFGREADQTVNEAGWATAAYLTAGGDTDRLKRAIGGALVREDVGFHPRQNVEAAFHLHAVTTDDTRANIHLIAAARYLAAHTPTRRAGEQTFSIADRLNRGEKIHED